MPTLQASRFISNGLQIVTLYRTSSCQNAALHILPKLRQDKTTVICGDFNLCFQEKRKHASIQSLLQLGFEQNVTEATHFMGGWINHAYFKKLDENPVIELQLYSPY